MRIAIVIMSLEMGGGAEHDVVHLSSGLKRAGHEPLVITSGGRLVADLESEGVPVVRCPVDSRSPAQLWTNGKLLADILESHQIEVLNPQGVYPGLSGYLATRRLKRRGRLVPNIITIHMLERCTWWYYRLGTLILNRVADHVIVESQCEQDRLQSRGLKRSVTILHNCFPPGKFSAVTKSREEIRREMGWPSGTLVFLMPARMRHEKGHDILFQALTRPEVQALPVHFYLAGDGPEQAAIEAMAGQLGVKDKVTFGGFRRDLPTLYKGADVFLLSSRYESLPLSIREGMVASLPVIATDVGGISEAVEDGASGILLLPENSEALASAIVRLATDAALRERMGRRGHEIYLEKFDYDHWIARTVEVMTARRTEYIEKMS